MKYKTLLRVGIVFIVLFLSMSPIILGAEPSGPALQNKGMENGTTRPATILNTSGGTITTLIINATTQNPHWKAYVGNVTGQLILEDANNYSIYEWTLSTVAGEVYVTRSNDITWSNITCANVTNIYTEETDMNHTTSADDSINNTFILTTHDAFWTGGVEFVEDECDHTLLTYVNDTPQSGTTDFQEILLWDGVNMVYTTILEDEVLGFDLGYYDFQMIVPEKGWSGPVSSTAYYFYTEII